MTEIFLILSQYFILCTPSAKRLSQFFQGNYNESSTSRTAAMHLQTLLVWLGFLVALPSTTGGGYTKSLIYWRTLLPCTRSSSSCHVEGYDLLVGDDFLLENICLFWSPNQLSGDHVYTLHHYGCRVQKVLNLLT